MVFSDFDLKRMYRRHPLLSQFSSSLPTTIKELFEWMEFIIHNNAIANAGIKKLSETPVTSFKYYAIDDEEESASSNKNSWKTIMEDSLNMKSRLLNISYNTMLYGNSFISVYAPINRFLSCTKCGSKVNVKSAEKLKVVLLKGKGTNGGTDYQSYVEGEALGEERVNEKDVSKKFKKKKSEKTNIRFNCICDGCKAITSHYAVDYPSKSKEDINVVLWNPNDIDIAANPISGEEDFYYKIPERSKRAIKKGDRLFIATTPIPMIEAAMSGNYFKFAKGSIYHSKRETVSGVTTSWGLPSLTSAIPSFLTLMILRKANEKIASDYMVPLRTIFPSQTNSGSGDMYNFMGGGDFVNKINNMLTMWKTDPSAVQVTPFPLGVQNILGEGKLLTLNQEIEQLEGNIANSLGIPIEFIKGGLSYTAQGSSLRLLENQLARLSANLEDVLDFVVKKTSVIMDKEPIKISMVPFKIVDDLAEKSAIIQLAMSGQNKISAGTLFELFNLDSVTESKRIMNEQKSDVKNNLELVNYQQEAASDIEERAKSAAQMNNSSFGSINQQALMQEAQQYVEQLMMMDDGARKSQLDEMSKTNYVMYGVVRALIDMQKGKVDYAAGKEAEQERQQQGQ